MSEIKLKRCPFCGGEAILESDKTGKEQKLYYVSCKDDCITQYGYSPTKEYAIEKWNTRKPMQEIVERLEEDKNKRYVSGITNNPYEFGCCHAMDYAIEIVKEVGGMND